ncbi:restriction endonuclease type II-like protein [Venturia nashicola]|uniref:Restriction endonuclease type II-like protein n=1 Tax=Venturia nashicola TaxID=86259 RepID=A0A4Z1P261_9PEZI|nr:restriction endonuclease type II-like protein [Venturia nashicola]TLD34607.1 restriction endonuclease type II-like protein [Venturia nashicola]
MDPEDVFELNKNPAAAAAPAPKPITSNARAFHAPSRASVQQLRPEAAPSRAPVQQLRPEVIAARGTSSILYSIRQKGNPVLDGIKQHQKEIADIPADYQLGNTTCALFLSLKYHRLHPEYIYKRIQDLHGKYNLRIILVLVDITNHEASLKELSKTSLINNVTLIVCWSAAEAGRYLDLYKTYEHASPTMIKGAQSTAHSDKLIDFITVPRSVNKTDALCLVSNFGSVRTAVNARPEEILLLQGWGQTKVKAWYQAVNEPLRNRKAQKRGITREPTRPVIEPAAALVGATIAAIDVMRPPPAANTSVADADKRPSKRLAEENFEDDGDEDAEEAMRDLLDGSSSATKKGAPAAAQALRNRPAEPELGEGVMVALARLREQGG